MEVEEVWMFACAHVFSFSLVNQIQEKKKQNKTSRPFDDSNLYLFLVMYTKLIYISS